MKLLDELKIILYLLGLLFAVLLLKGLSMWEYNLRDKTTTYEEVYVEEFTSKKLGNFFKRENDETIKQEDGKLIVRLSGSDTESKLVPLDDLEYNVADTGYLELKIKTHASSDGSSIVTWRDINGEPHTIAILDAHGSTYQLIKTDLLPLHNFQRLELSMLDESVDSASPSAAERRAEHSIDYVKVVQQIRQEELF